jgi:hypothetical protein
VIEHVEATMTVKQAREAARQWVIEEGSSLPGFCGAYTAGSTNWLADGAALATTSDFDVMVVQIPTELAMVASSSIGTFSSKFLT